MNHKLAAVSLVIGVFFLAAAQTPTTIPRSVTGQYRLRKGEFRNHLDVQQLKGGKIKFQLLALWVSPNNPENIHNGEIQGVVNLANGVAIHESGDCKITMKFTPNRVAITESGDNGDCGFGANVTSAGKYRKTAKRPKFDF